MLIHEKGAMFKAHTDTEKIPGMFGTLVICLPSIHTGGDLVVRHCGQERMYKTAECQPSALCWYSDVHHEVLPVTSGYRWVLTYNLAISPDLERPSAALLQPETAKLEQALSRWLEHLTQKESDQAASDDAPHLYYLMEHEYTEASIALRALKTTDLARVQCLHDFSTKLGFDVFLAVLEKSELGAVEHSWRGGRSGLYGADDGLSWHELDEVYDTSISIKKLVDLDGGLLRAEMEINENDLENNLLGGGDPFEDVNDRDEAYEAFTGNSGPSATHFYRTTVAVLVPRSSTDKFLTRNMGPRDAQALLCQYAEKYLDPDYEATRRRSAVETMRRLAKMAWNPGNIVAYKYQTDKDNTVFGVLKGAVLCCEYDLFNDVFGLAGTAAMDPLIIRSVKVFALTGQLELGKIKQSMLHTILHADLQARSLCSRLLRPSENERDVELEGFAEEIACQSVKKLEGELKSGLLQESDGSGIMNMINRPQDYTLFKTSVLPILEASTSTNTPFVLGALQVLSSCVSKNVFPKPESLDIVKRLSQSVISAMDITKLRTEITIRAALPQPYYSSQPPTIPPTQRTQIVQPSVLTDFVKTCLTHSWDDLLTSLTHKITAQSASILASEFEPLWLTFLDKLLLGPDPPSPRYKDLTLALLDAYLTRHVGREPPPNSTSLTVPTTRCSCGDCRPLNAFLADPAQREAHFQVNKQRRAHLHRALEESAGDMVTHVTQRGGWCGTLVVTKVGTLARRERRAWEERAVGARKRLQALGGEGALEKVIGAEEHARILGMGQLLLDGEPRGVKRKAEEVEVVTIDSD